MMVGGPPGVIGVTERSAEIFQESLPYMDALVNVLQSTTIDPITDEDDRDGGRGDLEYAGQPPRPKQHTLSVAAHVCPLEHVHACALHGVTQPTPLVVVTQLKAQPLPPPPPPPEALEQHQWK
jgi:hypothetical protein